MTRTTCSGSTTTSPRPSGSSAAVPATDLARQRDCERDTGAQRGGDQHAAQPRAGDPPGAGAAPVAGQRAEHLREVPEEVDAEDPGPDDERGFVEEEDLVGLMPDGEEQDAGDEDHDRGQDQDGSEQAQGKRWR